MDPRNSHIAGFIEAMTNYTEIWANGLLPIITVTSIVVGRTFADVQLENVTVEMNQFFNFSDVVGLGDVLKILFSDLSGNNLKTICDGGIPKYDSSHCAGYYFKYLNSCRDMAIDKVQPCHEGTYTFAISCNNGSGSSGCRSQISKRLTITNTTTDAPRTTDSVNPLVIIIPVAVVILIGITIFIPVYCWWKKRRQLAVDGHRNGNQRRFPQEGERFERGNNIQETHVPLQMAEISSHQIAAQA